MRALLNVSPWLFIGVKLGLGELIVRTGFRPETPGMKWLLYALTGMYGFICAWGLGNLVLGEVLR